MRLAAFPVRRLLGALFGAAIALSALPARADFQSSITVRLIAPGGITGDSTPISESATVSVADLATGLVQGDPSNAITSTWMVTNEKIFFEGNSIKLRVGVGDPDTGGVYTTGYQGLGGDHARYEFDGLSIAGQTIVGFNIYAWDDFGTTDPGTGSGLANPGVLASLANLIDADTLSFDLDTLVIAARYAGQSNNFADFRIDLITRDNGTDPGNNRVPEPASLALFAIAALGAGAARRRA
ncbi:MAG: PEP-CTERM sorting domain-containing protein [Roseateles sp.]